MVFYSYRIPHTSLFDDTVDGNVELCGRWARVAGEENVLGGEAIVQICVHSNTDGTSGQRDVCATLYGLHNGAVSDNKKTHADQTKIYWSCRASDTT